MAFPANSQKKLIQAGEGIFLFRVTAPGLPRYDKLSKPGTKPYKVTCYLIPFFLSFDQNYHWQKYNEMGFGDLKTKSGQQALNAYLEDKSYIEGLVFVCTFNLILSVVHFHVGLA